MIYFSQILYCARVSDLLHQNSAWGYERRHVLLTAEGDVAYCYEHGVCIENVWAHNFTCRWSTGIFFRATFVTNTSTHSMYVSQRVFESRALGNIFGPKWAQVKGNRKLRNLWTVPFTQNYLRYQIKNNEKLYSLRSVPAFLRVPSQIPSLGSTSLPICYSLILPFYATDSETLAVTLDYTEL